MTGAMSTNTEAPSWMRKNQLASNSVSEYKETACETGMTGMGGGGACGSTLVNHSWMLACRDERVGVGVRNERDLLDEVLEYGH